MSRRDMVHLPNWVGLRSRNMAFFAAVFFLILTDLLIKPVGIPLPTMTTSYEPLNANPISSSTFNVSGIDMGILLHRWDLDDVFHLSEPVFTDWHSLEAAYLGWRIGRHQSTFCRNQWAALGLIISRPSELTDPKLGWLGPQGAPDLRVHIHMIHQIWRTCFDPAWCGMLDAGLSSEDMWPSVLVRWIHSSCQELLSALASSPGALEGSGPVPVPVPVAGTYCTAGVWLCDVVHRLYRFTTSVLESFTLNRRLAYSLLPGPLSLLFHMFTEPLVFVGLTFVASFGLAYAACSQRRLVKGRQQLQQRLAMRIRSLIVRTLTGGCGGSCGRSCSGPGGQTTAIRPRGSLATTSTSACPMTKRAAAVGKSKGLPYAPSTVAPVKALCARAVAAAWLIASMWPRTRNLIQGCMSTARCLVRRRPLCTLQVRWGHRVLEIKSWDMITARWWSPKHQDHQRQQQRQQQQHQDQDHQQQQRQQQQHQQSQRKPKRSRKRGCRLHVLAISPTPLPPSLPQEQMLPQQQEQQQENKQQTVQPQPTIVQPKLEQPPQPAKPCQSERSVHYRDVQAPHHGHCQLQSYQQTGQQAIKGLSAGHQALQQLCRAPVLPEQQQQVRQERKGPKPGYPAAQRGMRRLPAGQPPAADYFDRSSRGRSAHTSRGWSTAGPTSAARNTGASIAGCIGGTSDARGASTSSSRSSNGGYRCRGCAGAANNSTGASSRGGTSGHGSTRCNSGSAATAAARVLGTYDVPCEAPLREGPPSGPIGRRHQFGHNSELPASGSPLAVPILWGEAGPGLGFGLHCAGIPGLKPITVEAIITSASASASAATSSASSASSSSSAPPSPPSPLLSEVSSISGGSFSKCSSSAASISRSIDSCDLESVTNGSFISCISSLASSLAVGFGAAPPVQLPLEVAGTAAVSVPYYPTAFTTQPCRTTSWLQPSLNGSGIRELCAGSTAAAMQQLRHAPTTFNTRGPIEVTNNIKYCNFSPSVTTARGYMDQSIQCIGGHVASMLAAVTSATPEGINMVVVEPPQQHFKEYKELPPIEPSIWSTSPHPRHDPYGAPQGWKPWGGR